MPQRIQRKRTRGWRMPEGAVYVGRPSKWGNHWTVEQIDGLWCCYIEHSGDGDDVTHPDRDSARRVAVERFRRDLLWDFSRFADYREDYLWQLRGHDLACWCPLVDADGNPVPCHADVLLELANGGA